MKRKWLIRFEPDRTRPYTALSDKGSEAFFASAESLVRFLSEGGLSPEAIRSAIREIHSAEARHATRVELEDSWG